MKKYLKVVLIALFAFAFSISGQANMTSSSGSDDWIPISIKHGSIRPRSITATPSCYYNSTSGVVTILCIKGVSYISATVTRLYDNEQWSASVQSSILSFSTSTEPGVYLLELALSNGATYYGEYTVE